MQSELGQKDSRPGHGESRIPVPSQIGLGLFAPLSSPWSVSSALIQERDGGNLYIFRRPLYSFPQHELAPRVRLGGFVWEGMDNEWWVMGDGRLGRGWGLRCQFHICKKKNKTQKHKPNTLSPIPTRGMNPPLQRWVRDLVPGLSALFCL